MAMHDIKKAMDDVKALHALDRNSQSRQDNLDDRRNPVNVDGVQQEHRGRTNSRNRDIDRPRSKSPRRPHSPTRRGASPMNRM